MDKKLRETTNLGVEIVNSKRQVKRKLGHVVQFEVNVMFNLSIDKFLSFFFLSKWCQWCILNNVTSSHWRYNLFYPNYDETSLSVVSPLCPEFVCFNYYDNFD